MLKKYELKKLPEWMKQLRQKFLRYIFESKYSSEWAGRRHSVKKKTELFGEHRSEQTNRLWTRKASRVFCIWKSQSS